jgi:hypothetical protein
MVDQISLNQAKAKTMPMIPQKILAYTVKFFEKSVKIVNKN